MPQTLAENIPFNVRHPFYIPIDFIDPDEATEDEKLYHEYLESFRQSITQAGSSTNLYSPFDSILDSDTESSEPLVDLWYYISITYKIHTKEIQTEIIDPNSNNPLAFYYFAYATYANLLLIGKISADDIEVLITVTEFLEDNIEHRQNSLRMILHCLAQLKPEFYLPDQMIAKIKALFIEDLTEAEDINFNLKENFEYICAQCRSNFMLHTFPAHAHHIWNEAATAWQNSSIPLAPCIAKQVQVKDWPKIKIKKERNFLYPVEGKEYQMVAFTIQDMAKFQAHLSTPHSVVLYLPKIKGIDEQAMNSFFQLKLFEKGYINSMGVLQRARISTGSTPAEKEASKQAFLSYCMDIWQEYLTPFRKTFDHTLARAMLNTQLKDVYNHQKLVKEELEFYNKYNALTLFYQSLRTEPNDDFPEALKPCLLSPERRKAVIPVINDTLIIAKEIKRIFSSKTSEPPKSTQAFNLAGQIKDRIKAGKSIIIQSGSPILTEKGEVDSKHVFYTIFKYHNSQVKIIIVNGGDGLEPDIDLTYDVKDRGLGGYWLARETEYFDLSQNSEFFLKHYIYKTLILPFTKTQTTVGNTKTDLLENIYLKSPDGFVGFDSYKPPFTPTMDPTPHSFPSQVFSNCTIYNLKFAIKFLFDWNERDFGHFVHDIVCRYNYLLKSQDVKIQTALALPNPAVPLAGGGAGYLLGDSETTMHNSTRVHKPRVIARFVDKEHNFYKCTKHVPEAKREKWTDKITRTIIDSLERARSFTEARNQFSTNSKSGKSSSVKF